MSAKDKSVLTAKIGEPYMYPDSFGDSWASAYLDDGRVFALSCDTTGWNIGCGKKGSNWALNELKGDFTRADGLTGVTLNPMKTDPFDFGDWARHKFDQDGIRRMWKANSIFFIDGALYVSVSRHGEMKPHNGYIQDSINASIIRSDDFGDTWSMSEDSCYFEPMFPGNSFPLPCFIEYDRKSAGKAPDEGDNYVYALSNDGYWNNGSHMYLARIKREKMPVMSAGDWEFWSCTNSRQWVNDHYLKTPILSGKNKLSMAGAQYISSLRRYIMTQAYYPEPYSETFDTSVTNFEFYEAPAPQGPWTFFFKCEWKGQGYYTPEIVSKSITAEGDKSNMLLLTAGDWRTNSRHNCIYKMTAIALELVRKL